MKHTLYYVHDPMCSWCWGFQPTLEQLLAALPDDVALHRILGGLAPDSAQPMPLAMREQLQATWHRIEQVIPGTTFNHDFWAKTTPRRSTYPACRAVIAAREQGSEFEAPMISAIQKAYYLDAQNPSDVPVLVELSGSIGCDRHRFKRCIDSAETDTALMRELGFVRQLGAAGFPSLFLETSRTNSSKQVLPIPVSYNDCQQILDRIELQRAA